MTIYKNIYKYIHKLSQVLPLALVLHFNLPLPLWPLRAIISSGAGVCAEFSASDGGLPC